MKPAHFDLLYSPDCLLGTLFGCMDVLMVANRLWRLHNPRKRGLPFSWQVIDASGRVLSLPGWQDYPQRGSPPPDLTPEQTVLLVPGLAMQNVPHLNQMLAAASAEIALIGRRHQQGALIAGGFNAAVLLARSGILDGRNATISWMIAGWFATHYPKVNLQMDRPVSVDGRIYCSGAPTAHVQLMLELISHFVGAEIAQMCGNALLYQPSRFEHSAMLQSGPTRDSVVYKARQYLEQNIREPYSLDATAAAAAVSTRTLLRHFKDVQGMTPLDYLHKLRVERARQLLEVTVADLPDILEQCGYQDASAFRRIFQRETGHTPSDYRARYAVRASRRWWRANDPTPDGSAS